MHGLSTQSAYPVRLELLVATIAFGKRDEHECAWMLNRKTSLWIERNEAGRANGPKLLPPEIAPHRTLDAIRATLNSQLRDALSLF